MFKRHWKLLIRVPLVIIWLGFAYRASFLGGDVPELAKWENNETVGAITFAIFTIVLWALTSRYVTLKLAGEVIDASRSQIRQKYTNESAWFKSVPEPVSTPTYQNGIQALGEGDYATALKAFRASANDGNLSAMSWLGAMYHEGKGVSVNHREAAQWTLKAAEGGHAASQSLLGSMYQAGTGVAQNLHETIRWWRKAAEQGDSMAQYNLGMMYAQGEGVREDPLEARQWVEKAAEQGEAKAFYNLGLLYLAEPKDYVQAYMWLTLSIMKVENDLKAAERRRGLAGVMTPEQINEAETLAREWAPKQNQFFKDMLTEYQQRRPTTEL